MGPKLYLIAAACENMGIGYKNDLPWELRNEMAYFNRMTQTVENPGSGSELKNAVIMGRRTWDSIPEKFRPLRNRLNIVLTSKPDFKHPNVLSYSGWNEAMKDLATPEKSAQIEKVWVIGGNSTYKSAIESPDCHRIYLTRVLKNFECDVFFPEFDKSKFTLVNDPNVPQEIQEEDGIQYHFEIYEKLKE